MNLGLVFHRNPTPEVLSLLGVVHPVAFKGQAASAGISKVLERLVHTRFAPMYLLQSNFLLGPQRSEFQSREPAPRGPLVPGSWTRVRTVTFALYSKPDSRRGRIPGPTMSRYPCISR